MSFVTNLNFSCGREDHEIEISINIDFKRELQFIYSRTYFTVTIKSRERDVILKCQCYSHVINSVFIPISGSSII